VLVPVVDSYLEEHANDPQVLEALKVLGTDGSQEPE
jgi:hypothetical protein